MRIVVGNKFEWYFLIILCLSGWMMNIIILIIRIDLWFAFSFSELHFWKVIGLLNKVRLWG